MPRCRSPRPRKQQLPDSPEVADTLGWIYVKKDLTTLAIPQLELATEKQPNNAVMHYHLGVALTKAGDLAKGRRALQRALSLRLDGDAAEEAQKLIAQL